MSAYTSEIEIVEGFNNREEKAFEVVHHRFFRKIYVASVRITEHTQESEDIVNAIFIKLYTDLYHKQFESIQQIHNYLMLAGRNASLNYLRKVSFESLREEHNDDGYDHVNEMLELSFREKLWDIKLQKTIKDLPYRCIEIVKMIYLQEMSVTEIAGKMDIAVQTVYNSKQKGLAMLAKILDQKDFTYHVVLILIFTLSGF
jgi:RNA polymerase sigma factor (sigma-70 family)